MKNLINCLLLLTSLLLLTACTKDVTRTGDTIELDDYKIHFGSFGGLCGYSDSLSIKSNLDLYYEQRSICRDQQIVKKDILTAEQLTTLLSEVDLDKFASIELNSCDRCFDGLDTYINIESDDFQHRIQYGATDDIKSIRGLVEELSNLREIYRED